MAEPQKQTPEKVDLATAEMTERFEAAPVYAKNGLVNIRPATPGEVVVLS